MVPSLVPDGLPTSPLRSASTKSAPEQMASVPLFSALTEADFRCPEATGPQRRGQTRHFRPGARNYRSRRPPRRGPPSPASARHESQNSPRDAGASKQNKTGREGGGERTAGVSEDGRDGALSEWARKPALAFRLPLITPRLLGAEASAYAPRLQGGPRRGPCPVSSLAPARGPQPRAQRAPRARSPRLWRKPPCREPRQPRCPRQTQEHRSRPFPTSPRRGLLPVCGPRGGGGGRRSPALPWRCAGEGEGRPYDNDRFEAGLGLARFSQLKDKEKKEFCR